MSPHALAFVNEHKRQLSKFCTYQTLIFSSLITIAAEADSVKETTQVLENGSGDRNSDTVAPERTTVAADAIQSPPVRSVPLMRDHRQLPRLEIPAYLPPQTTPLVSGNSTDVNSYESSPTAAFPNCLIWQPRFTLQSQASPPEYVASPSYPTYSSARAPLAQMVSPQPSHVLSSYTPMTSPMPPFVNSEPLPLPLPPVHGTKRKYEDSYLRDPDHNGPKRVAFSSQTLPLDTLAIAASMEHLVGDMSIPVDYPVHFPANLMPANTLGFPAISSTTPSQSDEASPVEGHSSGHEHAEHDTVLDVNDWSL